MHKDIDHGALGATVVLLCFMCPATIVLLRNPSRLWLHPVLLLCSALLVWIDSRNWGPLCARIGICPPVKRVWIWIGLFLGALLPLALSPLWQAIGASSLVPPIDLIPAVYAVPIWEETAFRGILCAGVRAVLAEARIPSLARSVIALTCSATLFGVCHLMFYPWTLVWSKFGGINFVDFTISGLFFGTIWLRSGSLLPVIVMHAATNLMEFVYFQAR